MNVPVASKDLHSVYIVLGIICSLEMIKNTEEGVPRLYANTMPFFIRYLSILGYWYLRGSWNQSPVDTEG